MKKIICMLLVLSLFVALSVPAFAAMPEPAKPNYTNASSANVTLTISDSGLARVFVFCTGKTGTKQISAVYYLEKKVGNSWSRVDIGIIGNQWVSATATRTLNQTKTVQLNESGVYRATAVFTVKISTYETITVTDEYTF